MDVCSSLKGFLSVAVDTATAAGEVLTVVVVVVVVVGTVAREVGSWLGTDSGLGPPLV